MAKRTNNDLQNTTQKTKYREHGNHTKTDKSCTVFFFAVNRMSSEMRCYLYM